jgi:hypothetical protein
MGSKASSFRRYSCRRWRPSARRRSSAAISGGQRVFTPFGLPAPARRPPRPLAKSALSTEKSRLEQIVGRRATEPQWRAVSSGAHKTSKPAAFADPKGRAFLTET